MKRKGEESNGKGRRGNERCEVRRRGEEDAVPHLLGPTSQ
jgi:hypothetical protein